jgi:AbrB family looped-hinge helix DNA binding protein
MLCDVDNVYPLELYITIWYNLYMNTLPNESVLDFESSVGPKGQITLPATVRKKLGINTKDTVVIRLEGAEVRVLPQKRDFFDHYQTVPALAKPLPFDEMRAIAWEDHVTEKYSKKM